MMKVTDKNAVTITKIWVSFVNYEDTGWAIHGIYVQDPRVVIETWAEYWSGYFGEDNLELREYDVTTYETKPLLSNG